MRFTVKVLVTYVMDYDGENPKQYAREILEDLPGSVYSGLGWAEQRSHKIVEVIPKKVRPSKK